MDKKQVLDTGEIVAGFCVRHTYEGQKDFDSTYKEVTIKKRVKKIGPGDEDFIIEEYEDIREIPIAEVLKTQAEGVGIAALMAAYKREGINPLEGGFPSIDELNKLPVQDFSGLPEDPILVSEQMRQAFDSLDPALKGDAKTPEEFIKGFTQEKFEAYLKSKMPKVEKEEQVDEKD